ncbi:MAG: hypothetical protein HY293_06830 [Planctomycetes bacterium]|nr:hypothetical protein [Planctomycetota bacterium]
MERDDLAIDGLLRELARAPEGDDDAFVSRLLARTRRRPSRRPAFALAASLLLSMGAFFALTPEAPVGRIASLRPACLVPDAVHMRLLMKDAATGRLLMLGEVPVGAPARVPADTPLLLQAVGSDGLAVWTSPRWLQVPATPQAGPALKGARSVDFSRDVKPILDQHCAGCHAESELLRSAVKPFEARRSGLVTQSHAPLSGSERQQLALWVDLGAIGRP